MKVLERHISLFSRCLVQGSNPQTVFDLALQLIRHDNREVKEIGCEFFEAFLTQISLNLNLGIEQHYIAFHHIMTKINEIIGDSSTHSDIYKLKTIIRAIGIFSKSILVYLGEASLAQLFKRLVQISRERVL